MLAGIIANLGIMIFRDIKENYTFIHFMSDLSQFFFTYMEATF